MRIAIIGLGGVGGYLLAKLSNTKHSTIGYARGKHLQAIQKNGISIIEDNNKYNTKVDARNINDIDGYFDIVIFCVKTYDLESASKKLATHIKSSTILISLSNGVNNSQIIRKNNKQSIVIDGCIYILSHIQEDGVIRKKGDVFAIIFGSNQEDYNEILASVFKDASLRYKIVEDIQKALWKKYIFISAFGTLTSYYNKPINYLYTHRFKECKKTLYEIANVAKSKNIEIEKEIFKALDTASKLPPESSTSMHLDIKKGKKNELETLTGYIVKEAKKNNIDVKLMENMYNKLKNKQI